MAIPSLSCLSMTASVDEEVSMWRVWGRGHHADLTDHEPDLGLQVNIEHLVFQTTTGAPNTFGQSWIISCCKEMDFRV